MKDTIYRADAIEAVASITMSIHLSDVICDKLLALPSADAVKVAYICDGRKCNSDCSECFRTLDIEHARDFKLMGDTYFQQEAEAEPIVIRSKTLMPTKDFKEWAKRIRETNPNAVVIPCGAEVVSAEAVQGWIPCSERLPDEKDCPMDCMVTRYSEQIGAYVDMAVCERNGTWTHEDWDAIVLGDVESGRKTGLMNTQDHPILAWMPLPKPYKGGEDE